MTFAKAKFWKSQKDVVSLQSEIDSLAELANT